MVQCTIYIAPEVMFNDINAMSTSQRTHSLMSGLVGEFVPEWHDLYESILDSLSLCTSVDLIRPLVAQA